MEPVTWVLGGVALAAVTTVINKGINGRRNVSDKQCDERRESFKELQEVHFKHINKELGEIKELIKNGGSS